MSDLTVETLLTFLGKIEKLKSVPRHCVTADGVPENVAGHSWRTAMMAYLIKDHFPDINMDKVIKMCLLHDIGEAVTGDIPTFEKNEEDVAVEQKAIDGLLQILPDSLYEEFSTMFAEMDALETKEARIYKALDKLEAVIQHNESDISTWLPLEYDLQQTYAAKSVEGLPFLEDVQDACVKETLRKIAEEGALKEEGAPEYGSTLKE